MSFCITDFKYLRFETQMWDIHETNGAETLQTCYMHSHGFTHEGLNKSKQVVENATNQRYKIKTIGYISCLSVVPHWSTCYYNVDIHQDMILHDISIDLTAFITAARSNNFNISKNIFRIWHKHDHLCIYYHQSQRHASLGITKQWKVNEYRTRMKE